MKSLLTQEFIEARRALLDAATAVDARRPEEAVSNLHALRSICDVLIDLLEGLDNDKRSHDCKDE